LSLSIARRISATEVLLGPFAGRNISTPLSFPVLASRQVYVPAEELFEAARLAVLVVT